MGQSYVHEPSSAHHFNFRHLFDPFGSSQESHSDPWTGRCLARAFQQILTNEASQQSSHLQRFPPFESNNIWRFSINRDNNHSWMVHFMDNPSYKWMMTGGTPISGNLHITTQQNIHYHQPIQICRKQIAETVQAMSFLHVFPYK